MERYHAADCPVNAIVQPLKSKWMFPLLVRLARGPGRFLFLKKSLSPITSKTLASSLRKAYEHGFVAKQKGAYVLTETGRHLLHGVKSLSSSDVCSSCAGYAICRSSDKGAVL
ncbi:helix-turn-helix transcriptional regulator [Candidatus Woesearchaeota archaeon]|nr:helix-turn-helix transcriptional regulator [Candidatus Woesearchaeota archaeon]